MGTTVDLPSCADVVIVGGGIMGTSTAYFLSERTDFETVLLEKDTIAAGSTGDSSAILRHHYGPQELYTKMAWWSHTFYRRFETETDEPIAHAESPLLRAASQDSVAGDYAMAGHDVLESLDIPVRTLDRESLAAEYPMLEFDDVDFAVSDETAGYSDGADAANGFARAARANGATVATGVTVTDFDTRGDRTTAVHTDRGTVDCEHVVLAAGPWTDRLAAKLDIEVPLLIEREQVLILEPPASYVQTYPELTPTTALPGGEWYIRPDFGEGILVATHHMREEVDPDRYSNKPDEATLLELTELLEKTLPEAATAGIRGSYCGVYSTTPDHDFIIGPAGYGNVYLACGFSGHGFKHGPAVGRTLTDLIDRGKTDFVDVEFFSLDRFADDPQGHGLPDDYA